jgi:hypothetical protein
VFPAQHAQQTGFEIGRRRDNRDTAFSTQPRRSPVTGGRLSIPVDALTAGRDLLKGGVVSREGAALPLANRNKI